MKWFIGVLWRRLFLLIFLLVFGLAAGHVAPVAAQELVVENVRQEDLDGDGQPDLTVIETQIQTLSDDVRVYDGADNMREGTDWQRVTDFEDDTWVFDTLADGSAQLVIKFERRGESVTAQLFTDQDGDSVVAHKVKGTQVTVTESAYPSLTATAQGDWFLPDGQLNWNVLFQTDGPTTHLHTYDLTDVWRRGGFLAHDGSPDVELEFKDQDRDGIPEYGLWRVLAPTPDSWGSMRSWIWSNEGLHRPDQPSEFVFWPYLLSRNYESTLAEGGVAGVSNQNYFDAPPAISMAFGAGTMRYFFFPGYPIEQGFHVHTLEYFQKGELNYANFENIQAYYDLANDQDGAPELHIRHRYYAEGDPHGWYLNSPINEIRWSWNQNSDDRDLTFHYKLDLAGRHAIQSKMEFPDFSYTTIPYDEFPNWVINSQWDYGTFVASENEPLRSTEGIYAWGAVESALSEDSTALSRYLAGEIAIDLASVFQEIDVGWRGEMAPDLQTQPYLYFSPIDRKLHLLKASYGIWNINNRTEILIANLDGDGYLDQWLYLEEEQVRRELNFAANYLIYAGENQVLLKQVDVVPSLFETLPPRDHSEWLTVGEQLEMHQRDFAPDGFEQMMAQFDGAESQITGATMRDFRPEAKGFRFVLELQPGFRADGVLNIGDDLQPGIYLVTFDGSFKIEPSIPATFSLDAHILDNTQLQVGQPALIRLEATNVGLEDAKGLTFVAEPLTDGNNDEVTEVITQTIDLLAGQSTFMVLNNLPPDSNSELKLNLWIEDIEENIVAESSLSVSIPVEEQANEQSIFALLTSSEGQRFSMLALLAFAGNMILALFLMGRRSKSEVLP